jgi:hypothetical protein
VIIHWYSDGLRGWKAGGSFLEGARDLYSQALSPALRPTQIFTRRMPKTFSPTVNWAGSEGGHSSLPGAEVGNSGAIPTLPRMCSGA